MTEMRLCRACNLTFAGHTALLLACLLLATVSGVWSHWHMNSKLYVLDIVISVYCSISDVSASDVSVVQGPHCELYTVSNQMIHKTA